jgi:hypothetical protein
MILTAFLAAASCLVVEGDRILMADLAKAVPEFSAAAGGEAIGLAPAPRMVRRFFAPEIERLAKAHGIEVPPGATACFEGAAEVLTEARVLEALAKAEPDGETRISLVEFSRYPVPHGELEFGPAPQAANGQPVLWRGRVNFGVNRSAEVWARVRLARPSREVERSDTVAVEVRSGAALLKFDAQAESGGKAGERVTVRNPGTGARFSAEVEAKGKVMVDATLVGRGAALGGR